MYTHQAFAGIAALAALVAAAPLPLNINLGAYSPALVVGDGEISFGGGEAAAASLVNALEGANVGGAANAAAAEGAVVVTPTTGAPASTTTTTISESPVIANPTTSLPSGLDGIGKVKELAPRPREDTEVPKVQRRQNGFDRALTFAEAALSKGPKIQLGTGAGGSGVGILVDNNLAVAARPGKGTA